MPRNWVFKVKRGISLALVNTCYYIEYNDNLTNDDFILKK
jgi:hypothetical protein